MSARIHNRISPERAAIKAGDKVIVHKDDGSKFETTARSAPWNMGGHTWVVLVEGIRGAYALSRVQPVSP